MALLKTSLDILIRNSRLINTVAPKARTSWFADLRQSSITSIVKTSQNLTSEQWTKFRKELSDPNTGMRTSSLDITIIQLCNASKNLDLGKSYLKYLKENKHDITMPIISKYFQLLYNCRDHLNDDDRKEILETYDELRIKYPLLDAFTAESCILVVSITERWKDTMELLEMIKIACNPSAACLSAIIVASLKHDEPDIAWKLHDELVSLNRVPAPETYISYFEYCLKKFNDPDICVEEIGKLFQFTADHDLIPCETTIQKAKETFAKLGWEGTLTTLNNRGVCQHCMEQLSPLKLSEQHFSQLSKTVLDKVIVGNDVYSKSTPKELRAFVRFVENTKPYDVVIDGLNVAYSAKKHSPIRAAKQLAMVVRYFLDKNRSVLVLGRRHMLQWEKQAMAYIRNNSFLYLIDDLSADDPCLLYATLASGAEARFVSRDLMRQHKFVLEDLELKKLFKRWQMSRQMFVQFNREKLVVIPPLNYSPVAQKNQSSRCWHVPYRHSDSVITDSYEPPTNWLCLSKRTRSRRR